MIYIRRVRTVEPGTQPRHISHVQYSFTATGTLRMTTDRQVIHNIDAGHLYLAHHDQTGDQAKVTATTCAAGHRHLTSVTDGQETDDLLSLPRF